MRIVSLAPSNTEILFALGVGDQVVGVTAFCDYPDEAKKLPKVGGWTTANVATVARLKPDLVITSTFLQKEAVKKFQDCPFKVLHVDPRDLKSIYASFVQISEAVDRKKEAVQSFKRLNHQIEKIRRTALKRLTNKAKIRPRVYIEEWHQPPMVSGNWVPELVKIAGGEYFPIKAGSPSRAVTIEEIQAFNPAIIFISLCGFGERPKKELVTKRPRWEKLAAVMNNRVYVINDSFLNRPGPRLIEGLKILTKIIKTPHQNGGEFLVLLNTKIDPLHCMAAERML